MATFNYAAKSLLLLATALLFTSLSAFADCACSCFYDLKGLKRLPGQPNGPIAKVIAEAHLAELHPSKAATDKFACAKNVCNSWKANEAVIRWAKQAAGKVARDPELGSKLCGSVVNDVILVPTSECPPQGGKQAPTDLDRVWSAEIKLEKNQVCDAVAGG